ncbi:hypothetical protein [Saccharicrinis fermentans]|uniref:F5/8 type C domain protein n=2 Tax=Saccharicrinis fermentans TaxID=982 RepID=W7YG23_9BACT|nr:hypothetical protein [Saccharicrinis fermentans]GAF01549.1 hypothetical protein JCM21142_161 [Saccharicrinis fermentans DSM 9555 = JCM 21142]
MVATIDFGQAISIDNVSIGYLSNTAVWIFPPSAMVIRASLDDDKYEIIGSKKWRFSQEELEGPFVKREEFTFKSQKIRYLNIEVSNYGIVPDWHAAAGHKGWMFVDEILIN